MSGCARSGRRQGQDLCLADPPQRESTPLGAGLGHPTEFARRCEGEAITGHRAVGFASRATTSSVVHSALAM